MKSYELYREACEVFPGCVNSPVRAAVKPYPMVIDKAQGPFIYTVDGEKLIDYILGYGPLILGHRYPDVEEAIVNQVKRGWLYASLTEAEIELAKKILSYVMPRGMIRFVNSGTEATMLAIRLARWYTKRDYIVKFDGCYHGAHDYVLVSAGSAAQHHGISISDGVPKEITRYTLVARFNDFNSIEKVFAAYGDRVAAVIIEPVVGNMGVIPPKQGFLEHIRKLCNEYGSLLIFDEVITGFRLGLGGAQQYYNVKADIVVLGKIIGGGLPIGAVASRREVMEGLTPVGKVFNAGTFNAHPLSMVAGLATIKVLEERDVYSHVKKVAEELEKAFRDAAVDNKVDIHINRVESMLQVFFTNKPVEYIDDVKMCNVAVYTKLHEELRRRGILITPSQFEAIFTSYAHDDNVVKRTTEAIQEVFKTLRGVDKLP